MQAPIKKRKDKRKILNRLWSQNIENVLGVQFGFETNIMQSKIWVCDDNGPNYIVGMSSFKG